jgi:DNA repair exonuclease SbcCD ATPase subunit
MKLNMRFSIVAALALVLSFSSCMEDKESKMKFEKLSQEYQKLSEEAGRKDLSMNNYIESINSIEANLALIKEKEKVIEKMRRDPEFQKNQTDRILEDIKLINELLSQNRKTIAGLNARLKKGNVRIEELEKLIQNLTIRIEEKDVEIDSMRQEIANLNAAFRNLYDEYTQRLIELDNQKDQLNTAYFAYGTAKELLAQGVIAKEGGVLGIGKSAKMMKNFNKDYFTRINITEVVSIPLNVKSAKLLTTHADNSYKLDGTKELVNELVITNPQEFWSASKYLVILVE